MDLKKIKGFDSTREAKALFNAIAIRVRNGQALMRRNELESNATLAKVKALTPNV